jgi:NAD-dependent dihydropyrimidine dehydrogenase PreA subunit
MTSVKNNANIRSYKFHHIDTDKCKICDQFSCEEACFRGIYEVINKNNEPKCVILENREDLCVKCHICTTACKSEAIVID